MIKTQYFSDKKPFEIEKITNSIQARNKTKQTNEQWAENFVEQPINIYEKSKQTNTVTNRQQLKTI